MDSPPLLEASPYVGYAYAYPHKSAYRPLTPPVPLRQAWADEPKDALFLYIHIPFCEMRCGFCNLFTAANPAEQMTMAFVDALRRQALAVREALGEVKIARFAIGGGTPTFLDASQLESVLDIAADCFGANPTRIPTSVETSPRTASADKLQLLRDRGVERVSIGVQSFMEEEIAAAGRAQRNTWVGDSIERIHAMGFPALNIDLIYGLPGQTVASWLESLRIAIEYRPAELYLYPLYIRPLTGLERRCTRASDDLRLACYREGRQFLLDSGYEQSSMRLFRRTDATPSCGPAYCCQEDGMVGLGSGARSYTRALHYSFEYAVGAANVRDIIRAYIAESNERFALADYGMHLDDQEQRRRWIIKSVLRAEGLDLNGYRARFGTDAMEDLPELSTLLAEGLLQPDAHTLRPTPDGLERADAIGPRLYSATVLQRMGSYEHR